MWAGLATILTASSVAELKAATSPIQNTEEIISPSDVKKDASVDHSLPGPSNGLFVAATERFTQNRPFKRSTSPRRRECRAISRQHHDGAGGLAALQITMHLLCVFERVAMVDLDLHLAREDHIEQVFRSRLQVATAGGICEQ